MKSLSEKVIVIMGASSGIGEATARLLARKGAKLVIAARRQERLIAIKKELPEATILVQQADVTKEEEVQHVIKLTMEKYGRIDVLFNNAGVMPTAPLIEAPSTVGLTNKIYAIEINVVKPANISRFIFVFNCSSSKYELIFSFMFRPPKI